MDSVLFNNEAFRCHTLDYRRHIRTGLGIGTHSLFAFTDEQPRFSTTRFGDDGTAFAGLTLLYLAAVDLLPLFRRDWTYYHVTSILQRSVFSSDT